MIIIALLQNFSACFQRYRSRKKLASLPHELRKDMGIMQDSFETEVSKGNLFTLVKELVAICVLMATKKEQL
ncbi:hypothetical protein EBI01_15780 [Marinomonas rhizomae]|uniref:Uncharacterized protein n=1 Tax=Marinomonas rhizomae TaxID=491948 RepID=A0A366IX96_9GAMM|nr:hypothetical protein [Marinomonas rhizomae]RBP79421.1 hypothetical protein DFP80_11410 [Marinomonas rhizomae]RNF71349.1 hypothetical protein EBI01_15780 [Marinomonas rhizomae]